MLKLKKLRIRGVGRLLDEQLIDFDALGSIVQLDGQNNNTKGSSGAGKSTVFHALDYLLGISNKPATVLKCRYSEDAMFVQGEFDYDGKPLTITRHKKLVIDYHGEKPTVSGSSALTEEELDKILAIPRELFRPMMHKRQKEGGFFLNMAPKDLFIFLMNCLGLSAYKLKLEILEKKLKELGELKTSTKNALDSAQASLKATNEAFLSLGTAPVKEVTQELILELKSKYEKSAGELAFWTRVMKTDIESLEKGRPQPGATFDRTALGALEKEYSETEKEINRLKAQENDRQNKTRLQLSDARTALEKCQNAIDAGELAKQNATEVAEQLKQLKVGKCYTCNQDWQDLETQAALIKSVGPLREKIAAGEIANGRLLTLALSVEALIEDSVPKEIEGLESLASKLQAVATKVTDERKKESEFQATESTKNKEEQKKFAALQAALAERHERESGQLRGQADIDRRAFEGAVARLKAYEEARTRYEASVASLRDRSKIHADKVTTLEAQVQSVADELFKAEELKRGVKSHLSCSFDDALETISENATTLIRHIPNMANATIQIQGEKETQDGKVKEEVNAVIHMDGEENVDVRSLCGGERTALDLAIDLSVIDLIETEANKGIDIFILDEPFQGMDTVCVEMALEVLKNSKASKRLVIVDHNPEVKQMVESRLTVVRDGATSRIIQAA